VPLVASFVLGGGGGVGLEEVIPPCTDLEVEVCCVALAANFSFLAFCRLKPLAARCASHFYFAHTLNPLSLGQSQKIALAEEMDFLLFVGMHLLV
jgi:hypothetical protein